MQNRTSAAAALPITQTMQEALGNQDATPYPKHDLTMTANSTLNILLVENSPGDVRLVQEMLRFAQHPVFCLNHVNCLADAFAHISGTRPDLLLLDLSLPDSQGLETFLRVHSQAAHIPIIVLSGLEDERVAVEAVLQGAQDYLLKGRLDANLLVRAMRYAIARHRAEEQMRQSERFAYATLDALSAHIAVLDESGCILAVNKAWSDFSQANCGGMGIVPEQLGIGANYLAVCDAAADSLVEQAKDCADGIRAVIAGERHEYALEYPCHSPLEQRWFNCQVTRFPGDGPVRVVVAHENITQRKKVEDELKQSRAELQVLFDLIPAMIWFKDTHNNILRANQRAADAAGMSVKEIEGKALRVIYPKDADQYYADDLEVIRSATPKLGIVEKMRTPQGEYRWIQTDKVPYCDTNGDVIGIVVVAQDITESRQAEKALRANARFLQSVLDNIPLAIYWKSIHSAYLGCNRSYSQLVGIGAPAEILGKRDDELPWKSASSSLFLQSGQLVMDMNSPILHMIESVTRADGKPIQTDISKFPLHDDDGQVVGVLGMLEDITERLQAEEQLKRQYNRLKALRAIDAAILGSLDLKITLNLILEQALTGLNSHAARIFLLSPNRQTLEFAAARGFTGSHSPHADLRIGESYAGRAALERRFVTILNLNEAEEIPESYELIGAEGFVEYHAIPLISKGSVQGVLEIFDREPRSRDAEWQRFLETLADQAAIAIENSTLFKDLQRSNMELILSYDTILAEKELARKNAEQARQNLEQINTQLEKALTQTKAMAAASIIENSARSVLLSALPTILISVDGSGYVKEWNGRAESTFGLCYEDTFGKPFLELPLSWDWINIHQGIARIQENDGPIRVDDVRFTRPTGTQGCLGITLAPLTQEGAGTGGFLILGADITERKNLEAQLALSQKMQSIGQLAAGIAHEINTPIQYVGDNIQFIQKSFTILQKVLQAYEGLEIGGKANGFSTAQIAEHEAIIKSARLPYLITEIPKAIQESIQGIVRVAEIVRAMKDFSHPGTESKVLIDINRSIESAVTVSSNEWKYVASVELDLASDLPLIPCLPGDFSQVILNILINAAHAIASVVGDGSAQKGVITVSTRLDGEWVEIRIRDTGMGIADADRSKVFDLFFTTKEVGKGTGQGLALAYTTIVEMHGGSILFETEVGKGTTFILRLPLKERTSSHAQAA